jgi:uncharacterized membrane protein YeaQ/YmgE (transglycosylase-associated protein family)/ABC-type transport system involved in multi-copper enzyme maturation permease subunit
VSIVSGFGSAIGLILGALTFGSEYSWRTVATMAIQGPQRTPLVTGRVGAVLGTCLFVGLAAFAGGAVGAALVALFEPSDTTLPALPDVATAYGAAVLIIGVWCATGLCLSTLFRGTGWAIGLGLAYALAVESVLSGIPFAGRIGDAIGQALIGNNAAALAFAVAPEQAWVFGQATVDIPAGQAVAVLLAYLVIALAVTVLVFSSATSPGEPGILDVTSRVRTARPPAKEHTVFAIIGFIIVGLIAGYVARAVVPGPDPMGVAGTLILGVVGSFVGGFLFNLLFGGGEGLLATSGIIGSIIGAIIALLIYRAVNRRSGRRA